VEQLHRRVRERVDVYFVYVAEAHPVDEWQMETNEAEGIRVLQQASLEERRAAARDAATRLSLTMPVLVDGMDDAASVTFAAWPERLVVVGRDARIVHPGAPGPGGFDPAAAERALGSAA
jgi:hypothetical protein